MRQGFFGFGLIALALGAFVSSAAAEPLRVVATFSVLGDLVKEVGGANVAVTTLVAPGGDAHVYQPTPSDARAVAEAKLVVVNGLGMEGWLDRLIKASGYQGPVVVASDGVATQTMTEADDDEQPGGRAQRKMVKPTVVTDPHAWQNVANGRIYVQDLAKALIAADPANAAAYRQRAEAFDAELAGLDAWVRERIATVPPEKRKVITSHDAFGYFATAYGVTFLAPAGVSTETEPTASAIAKLVRQIKEEKIKAIFIESMSDPRLVQQLAKDAGAVVGGALYSDSLSAPGEEADTYVKMFRHNVTAMTGAMGNN